MNIIINKEDLEKEKEYLIRYFGERFIKDISLNDFKKAILYKRLIENIKTIKKGDIIYQFDIYKKQIESLKEYVVFSVGNNKTLLGDEDIIINNGGGYIAGGLSGRAVLKEDYNQYLKELEVLK
jgi:hypothetical protein